MVPEKKLPNIWTDKISTRSRGKSRANSESMQLAAIMIVLRPGQLRSDFGGENAERLDGKKAGISSRGSAKRGLSLSFRNRSENPFMSSFKMKIDAAM